MLQLYNAVSETVLRFVDRYGSTVAVVILVLAGCGLALRILSRIVVGRGPSEP
jgi:hypothetical protein